MGREQKRIEFMYGLFLVCEKKHFPGQSATRYRLLRRPAETLVRQGFYVSARCDCRAAVTVPQSAEFCTCTAGDGSPHDRYGLELERQTSGRGNGQGIGGRGLQLPIGQHSRRRNDPIRVVGQVQDFAIKR